jgi:hypothetical protein
LAFTKEGLAINSGGSIKGIHSDDCEGNNPVLLKNATTTKPEGHSVKRAPPIIKVLKE